LAVDRIRSTTKWILTFKIDRFLLASSRILHRSWTLVCVWLHRRRCVAEVATRWAVLYIAKEHRCQLFDILFRCANMRVLVSHLILIPHSWSELTVYQRIIMACFADRDFFLIVPLSCCFNALFPCYLTSIFCLQRNKIITVFHF
jgi:hypothetical protein